MDLNNKDFFDMDFSELFLNKHGEKIFNEITTLIKNENIDKFSNSYISIVFKIAFLDFFGLKQQHIENFINDYYPGQDINVSEILTIHSKSINLIKEYLKNTTENENNRL